MRGCKNCPELQMKPAEKIPQKEGGLYKEYSNAHDSSIEGYITSCRDDISPCLKAAQTSSILCRSTLSKQHTHTRFQHGANMAVVHCSLRPTSPYGSLCANIMSSMKPEIHNVMQRCQRRTESQVNTHKFDEDGHVCPEICTRTYRQTDRQTHLSQYSATPTMVESQVCQYDKSQQSTHNSSQQKQDGRLTMRVISCIGNV